MEAVAEYKTPTPLGTINITPEQVDLVKSVVFKGATDEELKLFFFECRRRGVHPLDRLIHPVVRKDKDGARRVSFQTSIDLFRSEAEGTGEYRGQKDVEYGPMTEWDKIDKKVPEYAKATIKRLTNIPGILLKLVQQHIGKNTTLEKRLAQVRGMLRDKALGEKSTPPTVGQ